MPAQPVRHAAHVAVQTRTGDRPVEAMAGPPGPHLLGRVPGYLALLDRYGVAWAERRSNKPGHVLYEEAVQVVVAPLS